MNPGRWTLDEQIAAARAEGFEVVQEGRVLEPGRVGLSFAERVEGLSARVVSDDRILDDAQRWVLMRR